LWSMSWEGILHNVGGGSRSLSVLHYHFSLCQSDLEWHASTASTYLSNAHSSGDTSIWHGGQNSLAGGRGVALVEEVPKDLARLAQARLG